ncbi:MAG: hypothetical protein ABW182_12980 [Sphingomonas sp.]
MRSRTPAFAIVALVAAIGCWLVVGETARGSTRGVASAFASGSASQVAASAPEAPLRRASAIDLSDVIRFAEVGECRFVPEIHQAFDRVLFYDEALRDWRAAPSVTVGTLALVPIRTIYPLEAEGHGMRKIESVIRFPDDARWRGLRIREMASSVKGYPDIDGFVRWELSFRDPPAALRRVMAAQGLSIPAGAWHDMEEGCGGYMTMEPRTDGSSLSCTWTC